MCMFPFRAFVTFYLFYCNFTFKTVLVLILMLYNSNYWFNQEKSLQDTSFASWFGLGCFTTSFVLFVTSDSKSDKLTSGPWSPTREICGSTTKKKLILPLYLSVYNFVEMKPIYGFNNVLYKLLVIPLFHFTESMVTRHSKVNHVRMP